MTKKPKSKNILRIYLSEEAVTMLEQMRIGFERPSQTIQRIIKAYCGSTTIKKKTPHKTTKSTKPQDFQQTKKPNNPKGKKTKTTKTNKYDYDEDVQRTP